MDLLSHLAQLSAYMVDKQLCTEEVGLDYVYDSSPLRFEQPLEENIKIGKYKIYSRRSIWEKWGISTYIC